MIIDHLFLKLLRKPLYKGKVYVKSIINTVSNSTITPNHVYSSPTQMVLNRANCCHKGSALTVIVLLNCPLIAKINFVFVNSLIFVV